MGNLGLGRRAHGDHRDRKYQMASLLAVQAPPPVRRYWNADGWWGDQKATDQCVGFSLAHYLSDGPVTHDVVPALKPSVIYDEAQKIDPWAPAPHDGTTVRAGAQVLQRRGLILSYFWAWDVPTVVTALRTLGPVVIGSNWYESMFDPDSRGNLKIEGNIAGGHAYVLDGVNDDHATVRVKNSWGRSWGRDGFATLSYGDLHRLLQESGEALVAVEASGRTALSSDDPERPVEAPQPPVADTHDQADDTEVPQPPVTSTVDGGAALPTADVHPAGRKGRTS